MLLLLSLLLHCFVIFVHVTKIYKQRGKYKIYIKVQFVKFRNFTIYPFIREIKYITMQ